MTKKLEIKNPFNLKTIDCVELDTPEIIQNKLKTAFNLWKDRSRWLAPHERIAILERTAVLMEERKELLIKTAATEGGKPLKDTEIEVDRAIAGTKLAAQSVEKLHGSEIPMGLTPPSTGRRAFTIREPLGVLSSISAFNHPVNLTVHQTAPAIAAGCPVIIKPASTTPLSCLNYLQILYDAGLAKEWAQAVIARGADAEHMVADPRVAFLSFIGSSSVGWHLKAKLPPQAHCALEHGGVAPVIVEDDADLEDLVPLITKGAFYHAGQVCVSVQRLFVKENILDGLLKKLCTAAEALKVGDPLDAKTDVGPLIDPKELKRAGEWVNEACAAGAELICGGKPLSDTCYAPTILLNPPENVKVSTKEVFGPVLCIYSYNKLDQAINVANSLDVAFQSAIFTKDIDRAFDAAQRLEATAVMINDHTAFRVDWMPFGGYKDSGFSIGGIPQTIVELSREKLWVFRSPKL